MADESWLGSARARIPARGSRAPVSSQRTFPRSPPPARNCSVPWGSRGPRSATGPRPQGVGSFLRSRSGAPSQRAVRALGARGGEEEEEEPGSEEHRAAGNLVGRVRAR